MEVRTAGQSGRRELAASTWTVIKCTSSDEGRLGPVESKAAVITASIAFHVLPTLASRDPDRRGIRKEPAVRVDSGPLTYGQKQVSRTPRR
ncbi:hypothetical protein GCM10009837_59220 [Streptomyces durmitorensis]